MSRSRNRSLFVSRLFYIFYKFYKMAFRWLPRVEICCFCIKLKIGVTLIAIYSMMRAFEPLSNFLSCEIGKNCHGTSGVKLIMTMLNGLLAVSACFFFAGGVVLLFMMCMDIRKTSVYVISVFIMVPLTLVFWTCSYVYNAKSKENKCFVDCVSSHFQAGDVEGIDFIGAILITYLLEGVALIYFAIVVNSYEGRGGGHGGFREDRY